MAVRLRSPAVAVLVAALGLALVVILVASSRRPVSRAVFPANPKPTRLAIRAPLIRPELTVMATLQASEKRSSSVWMLVDSGATGVSMPTSAYLALGLEPLRNLTIRTSDPFGRTFVYEAGAIPRVRLGELEVEQVVTSLSDASAGPFVLGQSVLAHEPWEIDWDRGTLTLAATPWAADAQTELVPLRKEADAEVVTIRVDGRPVEMVLDTGAFVSMIPVEVGEHAHLATRRVAPTLLDTFGGETIVRRVFTGHVQLGTQSAGRNEFAALPTAGRRAAYGLLGLDVLSRYRIQVVPGKHLALRRRGDVRAATRERIARWSFVPSSCEHVGCVKAALEPQDDDAVVTVKLEADLGEEGFDVLFGCEGDHDDRFVPTGSSFAFGPPPDVVRHVRVRVPRAARGHDQRSVIRGGAAWFRAQGARCRALEVLDLSPLAPRGHPERAVAAAAPDVVASYWP